MKIELNLSCYIEKHQVMYGRTSINKRNFKKQNTLQKLRETKKLSLTGWYLSQIIMHQNDFWKT